MKEVPAPESDVPGERASPTQPVPLKPPPLSRQRFTEEDATDEGVEITAVVQHARVMARLAAMFGSDGILDL